MRTEGWASCMVRMAAASIVPGGRAALTEALKVEQARAGLAAVAGYPVPDWVEDEIDRRYAESMEYGVTHVGRARTLAEVIDVVLHDVCSGDLSPPISYPRDVS